MILTKLTAAGPLMLWIYTLVHKRVNKSVREPRATKGVLISSDIKPKRTE